MIPYGAPVDPWDELRRRLSNRFTAEVIEMHLALAYARTGVRAL